MRINSSLAFLFLLFYTGVFSQPGRMLIVGGGSEKNGANSWSTPAYKWAGKDKRVAIIGVSTGSLAPYFTQQCGAAFAKEFAISSRDSANSQVLYDTLLTYQTIFFRGGDQYDYYSLYRNTKLQDAVNALYNQGATICGTSAGMHILSSIVYTAENGTVYSYECIENPNNQYVTLENDFFNFKPYYIFDTHFAERGRFGRLTGFLGNYKLNQGIDIIGIGMDDMTCMTVDENGLGTVMGTGCANIYKNGSMYALNGTKLLVDSVQVTQLLQGCTYDFVTHQPTFNSLNRQINTSNQQETGNYTILASGSNVLSDNQLMLNELVNNLGNKADTILLLTGNASTAAACKDKIIQLGATEVIVVTLSQAMGTNPDLESKILQASKILFVANSSAIFAPFLNTENGKLLKSVLHKSNAISAFLGDDSRFAGHTVVENYYTEYASWYSELTFMKGLDLLKHTVIMPNTFFSSDMYENTATAVPYAMARDTLRYGIWLTNHNFMKYSVAGGKTWLSSYGTAPVMIIRNDGSLAGFSSQTGSGSSSAKPRMVAGFDKLTFSLIDATNPYELGTMSTAGKAENNVFKNAIVYPNPTYDEIQINYDDSFSYEIFSISGTLVNQGKTDSKSITINVSQLESGMYFIKVSGNSNNFSVTSKFVKR